MTTLKEILERLESGLPPPADAGLFGASPSPRDCALVIIPTPWDATTSYRDGTSLGPEAVVQASHQLDLEDAAFERPYRAGIAMLPVAESLKSLNRKSRAIAVELLESGEEYVLTDPRLEKVNRASREINAYVYEEAQKILAQGKIPAVLGGDHSSPFGLMKALAETYKNGFGVLHFDAHFDLRNAYEGFEDSHASIMHNALERLPEIRKLVQVGIRDFSKDEFDYQKAQAERASVFFGRTLFQRKARGDTWLAITRDIIAALPELVYVSFDIDGLDPSFCPQTGTPVPGGLSFDEACFVLEELAKSGRKVIGFDLCEVAPASARGDQKVDDEWDANVGARVLYKLCGAALYSQGFCRLSE